MVDTRTCDTSGDGDMESSYSQCDVESCDTDVDAHVDLGLDAYVELVATDMETTTSNLSTTQGNG